MRRAHTIAAILLLCVSAVVFVTWRIVERRDLVRNVSWDAQWFSASLKNGNERAAANYLSRSKMTETNLQQALMTNAKALLTTDFDSVSPHLTKEDRVWLATFDCRDGVELRFYTEDDGTTWYVYDLRKK
jgi:hypothetical protein